MRPTYMTAIRPSQAKYLASDRSCVTKTKVTLSSFRSRSSMLSRLMRIETSTIDVASSATISLGLTVSARATETRCR